MTTAGTRKTDEPREQYDLSGAVRRKPYPAYGAGTSVVVLKPDVAERFPRSIGR